MVSRNDEGNFETTEFDFVTWQTDLTLLYQAKFNRTQFLIGPTANYHSYRGVNTGIDSMEIMCTPKVRSTNFMWD